MGDEQKSALPIPVSANPTVSNSPSLGWSKWNTNNNQSIASQNRDKNIESIDPLSSKVLTNEHTDNIPQLGFTAQTYINGKSSADQNNQTSSNKKNGDDGNLNKTEDRLLKTSSNWWTWTGNKIGNSPVPRRPASPKEVQNDRTVSNIPGAELQGQSDGNDIPLKVPEQEADSNWLLKTGTITSNLQTQSNSQPETNTQQDVGESQESWSSWANPYRRVSSVVGYVYNPIVQPVGRNKVGPVAGVSIPDVPIEEIQSQDDAKNQIPERDHQENINPIIHKQASIAGPETIENSPPQPETTTSWLPTMAWLWPQKDTSSVKVDLNSDEELYKSAKKHMESSPETLSYAIKTCRTDKTFGDLSVYGTLTEKNPVQINAATPITSNEAHELLLNPTIVSSANSSSSKADTSKPEISCIVPDLNHNFRTITLKTRTRIISEHLIFNNKKNNERHLYRLPEAELSNQKTVIRNAIVIGIHGFYPLKMVKALINQYSGNSMKLANEGAKSLREWGHVQGFEMNIETIALEGYGNMETRVSQSLVLLENWLSSIKNCDYLLVVSHSQSVPVSIELLSRLINRKVLDDVQKISLLAMSGGFLGPYIGLDSKLVMRAFSLVESEIINELLELQDPESTASKRLLANMNTIINFDVKVTIAGSLDDQIIPLYSSLAIHLDHPNIIRTLYMDKSSETPDFLKKLFNLLLMMRNLGHSDNNMILELSKYFQGQVTSGTHCNMMKESKVYMTAIRASLETTSLYKAQRIMVEPVNCKSIIVNPYHLPWCMRGVFNDLRKIKNINNSKLMKELMKSFKEWDPATKQSRELRYCINAIEYLDPDELLL